MATSKGPEFLRFSGPIIKALREKGCSGTASEIVDRSIEMLKISEEEQGVANKNGGSRVRNQVNWAKYYLVQSELLESSGRGIWKLTEDGARVDVDKRDFVKDFKAIHKRLQEERKKEQLETEPAKIQEEEEEEASYQDRLREILKALPPAGFERLCQRLLREAGFEKVDVTGRSGDGGVDGTGVLHVNPFVSFNVLFQCKRYTGSVSPSQVRDFRGAMQGRADKGIIITTGTFTLEAKKEARRDGAPPIKLVDGDDLVRLFESLEFGLKPRTTFDVDEKFFDEFRA